MDAFVIRIPVSPARDTSRMARLQAVGWRAVETGMVAQAALSGRAEEAQAGDWQAFGLAVLYNAGDVRSAHPEAGQGDMALIAHLRAQHGPEFTQYLSGGFSVVLVHTETGAVEAYRDHFGIIPFYYCVHGSALTCGSDMRAVLHLSEMPLTDNPTRIADFIAAEEIDRDMTALSGLMRLPAAHRLIWADEQARTEAYWSLSLPKQIAAQDAPAQLRAHLQRATQGAMQSTPQVGAMLSGGLDSSTLAGLAARALQDQGKAALPTLSFTYGAGNPMDETPFIDAANAAFATAPHDIPMTTAPSLSEMQTVIEEQMDLFLAFGLQKSRNIYRIAAQQGLTALLDGHGGDEVISHGFDGMIELAARRQWWRLFVEMRGVSRIYGHPFLGAYCLFIVRHSGFGERALARRVLNRLARILLPRKTPEAQTFTAADMLAPDLRAQLDPDTRYAPDPGPQTQEDRIKAERRTHLENLTHPRSERAFEILHCTAAAHGILPLYPFFDKDLAEFCLSVPAEAKLRGGRTRWVLREAMRDILPEKIRMRTTKADFSDEFRATVLEHFNAAGPNPFEALAPYVDLATVRRLQDTLSDTEGQTVNTLRLWWRLAVLAQWQAAFETWQSQQAQGRLV